MDITINNLSKSYANGKFLALKNCNLHVKSGEVFALLGPNGAGKTTLVKSLLSLLHFDSGEILLDGQPHHQTALRSRISYLPERFTFYPYYTVEKVLAFVRSILKDAKDAKDGAHTEAEDLEQVLQKAGLLELRTRKVKTLSKGQLQRVGIAQLLIGASTGACAASRLFILDEPFSGLDPLGIRDLKRLIGELNQAGHTFFINSHILSEVEQVAGTMALMNRGEILVQGEINKLKQQRTLEDFFCQVITDDQELKQELRQ
ncbi:MAG: ABC transporter ATP-binding protein [Oligoflexia bacterium]|nr:ABC transporter ATP-binding protein [Oligoflexia bacterium]